MILQTRTRKRKTKIVSKKMPEKMLSGGQTIDARAELIQMLIPLGLNVVNDALQEEMTAPAGVKYSMSGAASRWGQHEGKSKSLFGYMFGAALRRSRRLPAFGLGIRAPNTVKFGDP